MVELDKQLDGLIEEQYVPSSIETKKAVLMYFFVGIVAALSKAKMTPYEFFHLKQSLGRWVIFFVAMMISVIFIFIPRFRVIPILFFLWFLVLRVLFVKQAYEGRYVIDEDKILMPIFAGLGAWMLSIFELDTTGSDGSQKKKSAPSAEDPKDKQTGFEGNDV